MAVTSKELLSGPLHEEVPKFSAGSSSVYCLLSNKMNLEYHEYS